VILTALHHKTNILFYLLHTNTCDCDVCRYMQFMLHLTTMMIICLVFWEDCVEQQVIREGPHGVMVLLNFLQVGWVRFYTFQKLM